MTVLHKSWVKKNAFGGITTTSQCNRNTTRGSGDGMNIADTDEQVTCKFCLKIMNEGRAHPSIQFGEG